MGPPQPMLAYGQRRDEPFRAKVKWVAVAAAVMAAVGLVQQATNLVLYLFPAAFRGVGSAMWDDGRTDWLQMAAFVAGAAANAQMLLAAWLFLAGRDTRRLLVLAAGALAFLHLISSGYVQWRFHRNVSFPDRVVHLVWALCGLVQGLILPGLIVLFFHGRRPPSPGPPQQTLV